MKSKIKSVDIEKKVFDIKNEPMPRGAWWWWFWLFFFNNPKNPEKPRQLMILWSTKNVRKIDCNNLKIKLRHSQDRNNLDGAVAAWYFDGEKMNHNFLLEQCNIKITDKELISESKTPTSFSINRTTNTIKIGKDFEFVAKSGNRNNFTMPTHHVNNYLGDLGYSIIRLNRLSLTGRVKKTPIHGTAYFQRVFVTAPAIPWYWGIFHFENGGILTYFNPHVLGKSIRKDISFFDGKKIHKFKDVKVEKIGKDMPIFVISGENRYERIKFAVKSYSHSSWTFKKKMFGLIPNKLVYNEYPSVISHIEVERKTGEEVDLSRLGNSVGNAEHTTGILF